MSDDTDRTDELLELYAEDQRREHAQRNGQPDDPYAGVPPPQGEPPDEESEPQRIPLRDRLLDLDGLLAITPPEPLIDGLLYRNSLAQLAGAPGTYKTFAAVAVCCSLAAGKRLVGTFAVPKPATVIYAAAEGADGLATRILAFCETWNINPDDVFTRLRVLPCPIQLGGLIDVAEAVDMVTALDADLLVLDTRARCTVGLEENSATEQGKAIEAADRIRRAANCTVWVIHHSPRSGTAGRGTNAWDGAIWSDLRIERDGAAAVIRCEKHKDTVDGCDHRFGFSPHTVSAERMPGVPEERRRTLVLSKIAFGQDALQQASLRVVSSLVQNLAPFEGLTRAQIVEFAKEVDMSRSGAYAAINKLFNDGYLKNIGTDKRPRFIADKAWSEDDQ
jgi:hypothetical protein